MMKLASCFKRGNALGLPETPERYAEWIHRAAEAGHISMNDLRGVLRARHRWHAG
jgi:TPR repeat protein